MKFNNIEKVLKQIRRGAMVIVVDDENRENEGDLVIAAQHITGEAVNFMIKRAGGLICVPMSSHALGKLEIDLMINSNSDPHKTAFTVSVDHKSTTTGISAFDRATTIRALASEESTAEDFRKPGHIFPLKAKKGGVFERKGHTEASLDLMRLAGIKPCAAICEILNDDGTMARMPELKKFAHKHNLSIISVQAIENYRKIYDNPIQLTSPVHFPTDYGTFTLQAAKSMDNKNTHLVLLKGNPEHSEQPIPVRIHSQCFTGDIFSSQRCDCGNQLQQAMEYLQQSACGILIYLRQEGRGIGLFNKIKAYGLQDKGLDTVDANIELGFPSEMRDFSTAAKILHQLGLSRIKLITNNPYKIENLEKYGIEIVQRIPIQTPYVPENYSYLRTKRDRMQHLLDIIKDKKGENYVSSN